MFLLSFVVKMSEVLHLDFAIVTIEQHLESSPCYAVCVYPQ